MHSGDCNTFTLNISAWCFRKNSKFSGQEFEEIHRNIGSLEAPKQIRILRKVITAIKSVRIIQQLGSYAVW